jgi:hypothetical protein
MFERQIKFYQFFFLQKKKNNVKGTVNINDIELEENLAVPLSPNSSGYSSSPDNLLSLSSSSSPSHKNNLNEPSFSAYLKKQSNKLNSLAIVPESIGSVINMQKLTRPPVIVSPDHGLIPPHQQVVLNINLFAERVGRFEEEFKFEIEGSPLSLKCSLRGSVLTPSAEFSRKKIDFQKVSFGFLSSETVFLKNDSEIPFNFHIRFPNDGTFLSREYCATPSEGILNAQDQIAIRVDFIPAHLTEYNTTLIVDVGFIIYLLLC